MPKRRPDPVLVAYDEVKYGDLPWLDVPTEPGWYWFRVVPSTAIHGPALVVQIENTLYISPTGENWARREPRTYQRQWAGPLGRPVPAE